MISPNGPGNRARIRASDGKINYRCGELEIAVTKKLVRRFERNDFGAKRNDDAAGNSLTAGRKS
jgi:hypothetical protein